MPYVCQKPAPGFNAHDDATVRPIDRCLRLERPDRGALFVVSGPSGVGKSTLVKQAMAAIPGLEFSVSATTRPAREGEVDGREYHFLSADQFATKVEADEFLEHATVYDRRYGTLKAQVDRALGEGRSVLLDIDVQGARTVKRKAHEAVWIALLPPSVSQLEARIRARGDTSEAVIARRMAQVGLQLQGAREADFVVVNDDLTTADAQFEGIFVAELSRRERQASVIARILSGR